MLLENNPFPQDVRVRSEAQSLVAAGYRVTVVAPRGKAQPRREVSSRGSMSVVSGSGGGGGAMR